MVSQAKWSAAWRWSALTALRTGAHCLAALTTLANYLTGGSLYIGRLEGQCLTRTLSRYPARLSSWAAYAHCAGNGPINATGPITDTILNAPKKRSTFLRTLCIQNAGLSMRSGTVSATQADRSPEYLSAAQLDRIGSEA